MNELPNSDKPVDNSIYQTFVLGFLSGFAVCLIITAVVILVKG